ncbi:hypothetical protein [Microbacterium elymi]|uniref:Uncharacterized protein n=1 Tax=Microbacterium elymi TaxID=2909587 RepID=A0ABY5NJ46_9MICO|nr:hypothetical protein [Microbacterium elymi]UUT35194.1 hypothetical protein L2X98_33745 [Microbacterium elymi]
MSQLGFVITGLQVAVAGPNGTMLYIDLATDEWWLEFDGKTKYLDEAMRDGAPLEEVLLDEKKREDWIRAQTDRRVVRVGDEHIVTTGEFRRRLAVYGIQPPQCRPSPDPGPIFR